MDPRLLSICIAAMGLAAGGLIYGVLFCKKRNYLIGLEWFLLSVSSTNFMFYELTNSNFTRLGLIFLDTFSRAFGLPLITVAGLMVLMRGYRPSLRAEVLWFVLPTIATLLLLTDYMAGMLPYILLAMWVVYSLYLIIFVFQLLNYGERLHAFLMAVTTVLCQTIACIYDFYKIPGDETNVVINFYTLALWTWAYMTVQIYYSYCALERAKGRAGASQASAGVHPIGNLH